MLSVGSFLAIAFSPQYLWRRLRLLPSWRPFRPVTTVAEKECPALFLLLCAASISGVGQGLAERAFVSACVLWLSALIVAWMRTVSPSAEVAGR